MVVRGFGAFVVGAFGVGAIKTMVLAAYFVVDKMRDRSKESRLRTFRGTQSCFDFIVQRANRFHSRNNTALVHGPDPQTKTSLRSGSSFDKQRFHTKTGLHSSNEDSKRSLVFVRQTKTPDEDWRLAAFRQNKRDKPTRDPSIRLVNNITWTNLLRTTNVQFRVTSRREEKFDIASYWPKCTFLLFCRTFRIQRKQPRDSSGKQNFRKEKSVGECPTPTTLPITDRIKCGEALSAGLCSTKLVRYCKKNGRKGKTENFKTSDSTRTCKEDHQ